MSGRSYDSPAEDEQLDPASYDQYASTAAKSTPFRPRSKRSPSLFMDGVDSEEEEEEVKLPGPKKFSGEEAMSTRLRSKRGEQYSTQADRVEQREQEKAKTKRVQKRFNARKQFLAELHQKEKDQFDSLQKKNMAEQLKFVIQQADVFMNFLIQDQPQTKRRVSKKQNAMKKFIKKGISQEDIEQAQNQQTITTKLTQQPSNLQNGLLKEYQLDALNWLIGLHERGLNGILADEMGLGKTIETIAFIAYMRTQGVNGPWLLIVPLSTLLNWQREFQKWCPDVNLFMLRVIKENADDIRERFRKRDYDVIITSYEGAKRAKAKLNTHFYKGIVVDEAHKIKNQNTDLARQVRGFQTHFRMLLTGTPLQNNLHELWALLNYIFPQIFANGEHFDDIFNVGEAKGNRLREMVAQLHKILSFFMLRRTKADVLKDLPPKKQYIVKVPLSKLQIDLYKRAILQIGHASSGLGLYRNILMQLRKICMHPFIFPQAVPKELPQEDPVPYDMLLQACSKLQILNKLMEKFVKQREQVIIFSQSKMCLDILAYYMQLKDYKFCLLQGDTDLMDRQQMIDDFTAPDSQLVVFLLSTRAGGLGINLTSASKVIIYDSDFNPHVDIQAIDRCHRIGQTKVVEVIRLVSDGTVEQNMIERQIVRMRIDELVIQQGRLAPQSKNITAKELQSAILHGAERFMGKAQAPQAIGKDFSVEKMLKQAETRAKEWKAEVEKELDQKLHQDMLEDVELAIETINCVGQDAQREREILKKKLRQEFIKNITAQSSRSQRKTNATRGILVQTLPNKIKARPTQKYWQFHDNPARIDELLDKVDDLNEEEHDELFTLERTGFTDWSKTELNALINGIHQHGAKAIEQLQKYVPKKSEAKVREYVKVLMERSDELKDGAFLKKLETAIQQFKMNSQYEDALNTYIQQQGNKEISDWKTIGIKQTHFKDSALLLLTYETGYGKWTDLQRKLQFPDFRFISLSFDPYEFAFQKPAQLKLKVERLLDNIVLKSKLQLPKLKFDKEEIKSEKYDKKKKFMSFISMPASPLLSPRTQFDDEDAESIYLSQVDINDIPHPSQKKSRAVPRKKKN